jgi:hypothetical protein
LAEAFPLVDFAGPRLADPFAPALAAAGAVFALPGTGALVVRLAADFEVDFAVALADDLAFGVFFAAARAGALADDLETALLGDLEVVESDFVVALAAGFAAFPDVPGACFLGDLPAVAAVFVPPDLATLPVVFAAGFATALAGFDAALAGFDEDLAGTARDVPLAVFVGFLAAFPGSAFGVLLGVLAMDDRSPCLNELHVDHSFG